MTVGAALRRRRVAALRCEPLACGRRDPIERGHDSPIDLWAWRAAADHLAAARLTGIAPAEVLAAVGPLPGLVAGRAA